MLCYVITPSVATGRFLPGHHWKQRLLSVYYSSQVVCVSVCLHAVNAWNCSRRARLRLQSDTALGLRRRMDWRWRSPVPSGVKSPASTVTRSHAPASGNTRRSYVHHFIYLFS